MKFKSAYIFPILGAALLFAGCTKEVVTGSEGVSLRFSASVPASIESKATPVTSVKDFYAMGFNGTDQWFPTSGTDPVRVQITSGSSKEYTDYLWVKGSKKTFYAYSNNIPGGVASASIAADGVTLDITSIPTAASDQVDITLGRYIGKGNDTGTAAINFFHPLAQVVFVAGDIKSVDAITGIEISGVYGAGSTKLSTSTTTSEVATASGGKTTVADFVWTDTSGSEKVSQTFSATTLTEGTALGETFMLIPQILTDKEIKVTITATIGGESKILKSKINTGEFATGKTTTYTINYTASSGLNFSNPTVTAWGAGDTIPGEMEYIALEGIISNLPFTVSAEGKKVYFSKGNLQFRATADGTGSDLSHETADGTKPGIWRFAEEQWHTVGNGGTNFGNVYENIGGEDWLCDNTIGFSTRNAELRRLYTGWIDLFLDSSSGYGHTPWALSVSADSPRMSGGANSVNGTNWEWGHYNAISNGGNAPGLWRIPVASEYYYMIFDRERTGFTVGTKTNVNAVAAVVENTAGIMVFPDDFSWPTGIEMRFVEGDILIDNGGQVTSSNFKDTESGGEFKTSYSGAEFKLLENVGVLFLPMGMGYKQIDLYNWVCMSNYSGSVYAFYWTDPVSVLSTKDPSAAYMQFQFSGWLGQYSSTYLRYWDIVSHYLLSVRLVCDATSE